MKPAAVLGMATLVLSGLGCGDSEVTSSSPPEINSPVPQHQHQTARPPVVAPRPSFQLTLQGELAAKLPDDTELRFWRFTGGQEERTFSIADLPLELPHTRFAGQWWRLDFRSKTQGKLFAIFLARELFSRPGEIPVHLDAPTPTIEFAPDAVSYHAHYTANIHPHMYYRELPQWDRSSRSFTSPKPPELIVTRLADGKVLDRQAMGEWCFESRWWARLEQGYKLQPGTHAFSDGWIRPSQPWANVTVNSHDAL